MKPRTKFQHQVYSLSLTLPSLTKVQILWAKKECLEHIGYRNKKGVSCLDCGYQWAGQQEAKSCDCPNCGTKLKLETTRKKNLDQKNRSFAIVDVRGEFQIVRIFEIHSYHKSGKERYVCISEVIQQFILPDGRHQFLAKLRNMSYHTHGFILSSDMEIRDKDNIQKYDYYPDKIHPKIKVLPVYKRNGLKSSFRGISPFTMFKTLTSDCKFETLLKSKQFELLGARVSYNMKYRVERHWDSIKICIRNNYIVKDASIWLDHLDLLSRSNKDLRNPKYICPQDLIKEHNKRVRKENAIRRKRDLEKRKAEIKDAQRIYEQQKREFFGLVLKDGDITVKVLESVQEFLEEADKHKHCVFASSYYKKKDSLVFSARIKRAPVETVEISLSEMKILQSRGLNNKASKYNTQIVNLVNKNLHRIKKIYSKVELKEN